jgi:hypothetical protein
MRVVGQSHAPAASPAGKKTGTHFTGDWVGLIAGLDRCGKYPIGILSWESAPRSKSLYGLSYLGP